MLLLLQKLLDFFASDLVKLLVFGRADLDELLDYLFQVFLFSFLERFQLEDPLWDW